MVNDCPRIFESTVKARSAVVSKLKCVSKNYLCVTDSDGELVLPKRARSAVNFAGRNQWREPGYARVAYH